MRAPVLPDDFCNNENITINKKQELSHPPADSFFGEKKKNAPTTLNPSASVLSLRRDLSLSLSITRVKDAETCSKLYRRIPSAVRHPVLKSNTSPFFLMNLGHQPLSPPLHTHTPHMQARELLSIHPSLPISNKDSKQKRRL